MLTRLSWMSSARIQCASVSAQSLIHGLLHRHHRNGEPYFAAPSPRAGTLPCPTTGRVLMVAGIDADTRAFCAGCQTPGHGAFISFVNDLRMAYACPKCDQLVWSNGL